MLNFNFLDYVGVGIFEKVPYPWPQTSDRQTDARHKSEYSIGLGIKSSLIGLQKSPLVKKVEVTHKSMQY